MVHEWIDGWMDGCSGGENIHTHTYIYTHTHIYTHINIYFDLFLMRSKV